MVEEEGQKEIDGSDLSDGVFVMVDEEGKPYVFNGAFGDAAFIPCFAAKNKAAMNLGKLELTGKVINVRFMNVPQEEIDAREAERKKKNLKGK